MGMKAAIATTRSTGSIITTKGLLLTFLVVMLGLGGCATTKKGPGTLSPPLRQLDISSEFGSRGGRPHYGIDLTADQGTKVMSSADGKVAFAGKQRGFGKIVIIDHGGGVQTYYAHLSRIKTGKGKKVDRGQTIGLVGKTGNATGAHLHFEVRLDGRPVDPLLQLSTLPRG